MGIDIKSFYERYGPMVLRRCRRLLGDDEKAWDAMQDVFVQLLRSQNRLHDTAPSSLLFRMATNICLNRLRSQSRCRENQNDDIIDAIAQASTESQSQARLMLTRIFNSQRDDTNTATMAIMHWVDGMTYEEVAGETGLSVSGVRKRLRVLREKLLSKNIEVTP
ncbi:MAG: sigma-70 family RNA polymerase sigma factor [Deltaproteobacteria bacterium]|nr:sigma-70 family RNA polymerase sigma factor [Deltaproteobacteria bacterium]